MIEDSLYIKFQMLKKVNISSVKKALSSKRSFRLFAWYIVYRYSSPVNIIIIDNSFQIMIKHFMLYVFIHVNIYLVKYFSYRKINSCCKEHWQLQSKMKFFLLLSVIGFCWAQYNPNTKPGRTSIVHLFEWRWADIALECERYLAPKGFGGVQVGIILSINCKVCCACSKWYYDLYLWSWKILLHK